LPTTEFAVKRIEHAEPYDPLVIALEVIKVIVLPAGGPEERGS
jgi:hypothetical protein